MFVGAGVVVGKNVGYLVGSTEDDTVGAVENISNDPVGDEGFDVGMVLYGGFL